MTSAFCKYLLTARAWRVVGASSVPSFIPHTSSNTRPIIMANQDYYEADSVSWRRGEFTEYVTEDYLKRKSEGRVPPLPYQRYLSSGYSPVVEDRGNFVQIPFPILGFNELMLSGTAGGSASKSTLTIGELHDDVERRLRIKVNQASVEGGLNAAEYRKTSGFIRGAMVATARGLKAARRGDIRGIKKAFGWTGKTPAQVASDAWLAFTYGFRPLANDVYNAAIALEEGLVPYPYFNYKTGKRWPIQSRSLISNPDNSRGYRYHGSVIASGRVTCVVDDIEMVRLAKLGFLNPALIAWELVPYSFVVDWFVPVGEWLVGFPQPQGVSFLDGYTLVKGDGVAAEIRVNNIQTPSLRYELVAEAWDEFKDRKVLSGFPKPGFSIPDLSLTKSQLVSAWALLVNASR